MNNHISTRNEGSTYSVDRSLIIFNVLKNFQADDKLVSFFIVRSYQVPHLELGSISLLRHCDPSASIDHFWVNVCS